MNPARSERKSRRSSILKAPKPRQPLQNVELNASSADNSPSTTTAKIKRRVSFAEKKHVKEFCDSLEQGTVWDNTYEESELSQMKNSQNSNNDEKAIGNDDANNSSKNITKFYTKSIEKLEIIESNGSRENPQISIVTESAISCTQSVNTENTKVVVGFEVLSKVEREFTSVDSSKKDVNEKRSGIPLPANYSGSYNFRRSRSAPESVLRKSSTQGEPVLAESADRNPFGVPETPDVDCNQVPMDETLIDEHVLMETAEKIARTELSINCSLPKSSLDKIPDVDLSKNTRSSIDFPLRKIFTNSKGNSEADEPENREEPICPTELTLVPSRCPQDQRRIMLRPDNPLEMTEDPSKQMATAANRDETATNILHLLSTDSKGFEPKEIELRPDRISILHMKPTEIPSNSFKFVQKIPSSQHIEKLSPEKPTTSANESLDSMVIGRNTLSIGETGKTTPKQTTIFNDISLEFGAEQRNVPITDELQKIPPEGTTMFNDEFVECTDVAGNVRDVQKSQRTPNERTKLFHDKSMDFTGVVTNIPNDVSPPKSIPGKITMFTDRSVAITNIAPSSSTVEGLRKTPSDKTTIFHDQSVDMTEVVRSGLSYQDLQKNLPDRGLLVHKQSEVVRNSANDENQPPEKTTIFHNQSMEITKAVRNAPSSESLRKLPSEKTTIFHDQSVDTTEVVRSDSSYQDLQKNLPDGASLVHNQSEVVRTSANNENQPPEKITIFHDQSMDMTNVVRNGPSCETSQKLPYEKTTIFHDQSVDMTEVVRSRPSYEDLRKNLPDRASLFHTQSEVVRNGANDENQPPEKTTIFHDQSVDMTEVVRSRPTDEDLQKNLPDRASLFHNQSRVVCNSANNENLPPEKTSIFYNQSMEITNAVRSGPSCESLRKIPSEKTTIFHDQSVDMTEVVRSRPNDEDLQKNLPDRASLFHNQPLSICNSANNENLPPEKTSIFHNQSMEITNAVRSGPSCESLRKLPSEKTTIFHDQSVDMTEVVRSRPSYEDLQKNLPDRASLFHNQSGNVRKSVNNEKQSPEKTTMYHDQSMEMTNFVPNSRRICENLKKVSPEKTTIFRNQSVDMTEVVRSISNYEEPQRMPLEKPKLFDNQSLNVTGVVGNPLNHKQSLPEKATISHNQSDDMPGVIENLPTYENVQKHLKVKTIISQDQPLHITEDVRFNMDKSRSVLSDKTMMVCDKSVTTTKTVPKNSNIEDSPHQNHQRVLPSITQRPSVLHVGSSARANFTIEKENVQPENQSLELTETVPQIVGVSKLLSRDSCTLAVDRRAKHKLLDVEEANGLIASIEVPRLDLAVRSPESKRPKSLGMRNSIDVTAAVPFVVYPKIARRNCDENKDMDDEPPSSEVNYELTHNTEVFGDELVETTKQAINSADVNSSGTFANRLVECVRQELHEKTPNFQTKSLDLTKAFPCFSHPSQSIRRETEDSTRNDGCSRPYGNTMCLNDSMDITRAIPSILKSTATMCNDESTERTGTVNEAIRIRSVINENTDRAPTTQFGGSSAYGGNTIVYGDELMELTKPIEQNRTRAKENEKISSNAGANLEMTEKTMIYCDDSMELTEVVTLPSQIQTEGADKENCPMGMNNVRSQSCQRPKEKESVEVTKDEWLRMIKSVPFLSSRKNIEDPVKPIESVERSSGTESEEITGVIPFPTENPGDDDDEYNLESVGSTTNARSETIHMTDVMKRSLGASATNPEHFGRKMERQLQSPELETGRPVERSQPGQSQVAKKLFQKPVTSQTSNTATANPTKKSVTADLDAEIRKLAESFALSNSVDESGFDQATFLRQQARCMEDYEANSEASQEYPSVAMSTRKVGSFPEKRGSPDLRRPDDPKDSVAREELVLPTADWSVTSKPKGDITVSGKSNLISENNRSGMAHGHYDRSLEELRCRAHSVREFRPEETACELTTAISMADPGIAHETIFDQEPPSFVFNDSTTMDISAHRDSPVDSLPVVMNFSITADKIEPSKSPKLSPMPADHSSPTTADLRENNLELVKIVTLTTDEKIDGVASVEKNDNSVAQSDAEHRRHSFAKKRHYVDATTQTSFPSETHEASKKEPICGTTNAAEFSSESPDGPNKKIRRQENVSINERTTLPAVDKENKSMDLTKADRFCGKRHFSDSEVVYTGPFGPASIGDPSIVVKTVKITTDLEFLVSKSPFAILKTTLENLAKRPGTIWEINRLDEKIIAFNFFSKSIVLVVCFNENGNCNSTKPIKAIGVQSQLVEEGTEPGVRLVHNLIMKKIGSSSLTESYPTYEDVPRLLEFVSTEVKSGMDFVLELKNLRRRTIMDIHSDSLTFRVRTRDIDAGIILNITIEIKPFDEITPNDITVFYLLGDEKVREDDIKNLITNVKRDHTFLQSYINEVKDYIDLMGRTYIPVGTDEEDSF